MAFKTAFFSALLALASVSGLMMSPEPLTQNQAVMFCATRGVRLADVTTANLAQVNHDLKGYSAWVGSWDYNYYNNACLGFINGHIGEVKCEEKHIAACNDPVVLKSAHQEQQAHVVEAAQVHEEHQGEKMGARASRRSHKPCHKPCESSSSSSESCLSSSAAECALEYVYMTNTVTQVFTSFFTTTLTSSTVTVTEFFGTVQAYTVSA